MASKRERIEPKRGDKRYTRRDEQGRFSEQEDVGKAAGPATTGAERSPKGPKGSRRSGAKRATHVLGHMSRHPMITRPDGPKRRWLYVVLAGVLMGAHPYKEALAQEPQESQAPQPDPQEQPDPQAQADPQGQADPQAPAEPQAQPEPQAQAEPQAPTDPQAQTEPPQSQTGVPAQPNPQPPTVPQLPGNSQPDAKRGGLGGLLSDKDGGEPSFHLGPLHPKLAIISSGAGIGPDLHFWTPDIGNSGFDVHASAAYSINRYEYYAVQIGWLPHHGVHLPRFVTGTQGLFPFSDFYAGSGDSRFRLYASARYRRYPREDFYGIGRDSGTLRTDYLRRDDLFEGVAELRVWRGLTLSARGGLLQTALGRGRDSAFEDTQLVFDDASAPGLFRQPDFLYYSGGLFADSRDEPDNPHHGGALALAVARFDDRGGTAYQWTRVGFDARLFRALFSTRHLLALRVVTSLDYPDAGSRVPFYMQSALGGSHLLRGFHSFRFRDEKLVGGSAEYRFEVVPKVELAAFYDTGTVLSDMDNFDLRDLEHTWGVGLRLKSPKKVRLRVDVGRSREGTRVDVKLGQSF